MAILGGWVFLMSEVPLYLIEPISSDLAKERTSFVHDSNLLDLYQRCRIEAVLPP